MKSSVPIVALLAVVAVVSLALGVYSYWDNAPTPAPASTSAPPAAPASAAPAAGAPAVPSRPALDEAGLHPQAVALTKLGPADTGAVVSGTPPVVTTTTHATGYAAIMPIPEDAKRDGPAIIEITLRVTAGKVGVGFLTKDQSKSVAYMQVAQSEAPATIKFQLPSLTDVGFLLIGNARDKEGLTSTVEVDSMRILQ